MTVAKLKPCPWCGGVLQEARVVEGDTFRWRKLQGCCTDGPEIHIDTLADDRVGAEERAAQAAIDAWNTRAPQWQPIESAPADELVVVCWLDDEDTENPERHEFDYIEDGMWVNHANLVEHAQAVAPPGSRVPKDHAPYQWWMPLPAPPEVEG
ncbi:TPA: Lar family restriction alleviation protein [Stenotrophomonas maltophilia]